MLICIRMPNLFPISWVNSFCLSNPSFVKPWEKQFEDVQLAKAHALAFRRQQKLQV